MHEKIVDEVKSTEYATMGEKLKEEKLQMSKIVSYQEYLQKPNVISFREADEIYQELLASVQVHDEDFLAQWNEVMKKFIRYANIRAEWFISLTQADRGEKSADRTTAHDSVITNLNLLAKYMDQRGWNADWRRRLGQDEKVNRKRLGDFACYLAYVYAINAR